MSLMEYYLNIFNIETYQPLQLDDKDISHIYRKPNYAKAKDDSINCNSGDGSSNDINPVDTNSNGDNIENYYAKSRPKVPAGSFLAVTGTSMPSNATHTKCNIQLQTNQHWYRPVSPLGPAETYTTWKGATSEPVKAGANQVEGQLLCFGANGAPNLIKHLVHNFTGIESNPGIPTVPALRH